MTFLLPPTDLALETTLRVSFSADIIGPRRRGPIRDLQRSKQPSRPTSVTKSNICLRVGEGQEEPSCPRTFSEEKVLGRLQRPLVALEPLTPVQLEVKNRKKAQDHRRTRTTCATVRPGTHARTHAQV